MTLPSLLKTLTQRNCGFRVGTMLASLAIMKKNLKSYLKLELIKSRADERFLNKA